MDHAVPESGGEDLDPGRGVRELQQTLAAGNRGGGRYPEHELWEAVQGYLDLLDADKEV